MMTAVFARDAWRPLFFIASCGLVGRGFLRYEVTEGVPTASDRLRLGCMKKSGSLPRFVPNRVFRIFSLATLAFRPLVPSVLNVS